MPRRSAQRSESYKKLRSLIANYYELCKKKHPQHSETILNKIRSHILCRGVSSEDFVDIIRNLEPATRPEHREQYEIECTQRGKVWKALVGVKALSATEYQRYITLKKSRWYPKIRNDTFRTFATDEEYLNRVPEPMLIRVLNSFVHKTNHPYIQGLNLIAGMILYTMPELDAFATFCAVVQFAFPTYWISRGRDSLTGAYAGALLVRETLCHTDEELARHLQDLHPFRWAFPAAQSFSSIAEPFQQVMELWDFFFAFGFHMNILAVVAQIRIHRTRILAADKSEILQTILSQRHWPRLDTRRVIDEIMRMLPRIREHQTLWRNIIQHCVDLDVAKLVLTDDAYSTINKHKRSVSTPSMFAAQGALRPMDINRDDSPRVITSDSDEKTSEEFTFMPLAGAKKVGSRHNLQRHSELNGSILQARREFNLM